MQHKVEFFLYKIFQIIIHSVSLRTQLSIAKFIAYFNVYFLKIRVSVVKNNCQSIFQNQDPREINRFVLNYFIYQFFVFLDFIRCNRLNSYLIEKRIKQFEIDDHDYFQQVFKQEKILIISGHISNFILLGQYIHQHFSKVSVVVKKQKNRLIDYDFYQNLRNEGLLILDRRRDLRTIATMNLPQGYALSILGDQDAGKKGVSVPFLGRNASTSQGISFLIEKHKIKPLFCGISLNNDLTYNVHFKKVELNEERGQTEILKIVNQVLSDFILEHPYDWFWVHKRWKTQC